MSTKTTYYHGVRRQSWRSSLTGEKYLWINYKEQVWQLSSVCLKPTAVLLQLRRPYWKVGRNDPYENTKFTGNAQFLRETLETSWGARGPRGMFWPTFQVFPVKIERFCVFVVSPFHTAPKVLNSCVTLMPQDCNMIVGVTTLGILWVLPNVAESWILGGGPRGCHTGGARGCNTGGSRGCHKWVKIRFLSLLQLTQPEKYWQCFALY